MCQHIQGPKQRHDVIFHFHFCYCFHEDRRSDYLWISCVGARGQNILARGAFDVVAYAPSGLETRFWPRWSRNQAIRWLCRLTFVGLKESLRARQRSRGCEGEGPEYEWLINWSTGAAGGIALNHRGTVV
jgi:hypothetical protein